MMPSAVILTTNLSSPQSAPALLMATLNAILYAPVTILTVQSGLSYYYHAAATHRKADNPAAR